MKLFSILCGALSANPLINLLVSDDSAENESLLLKMLATSDSDLWDPKLRIVDPATGEHIIFADKSDQAAPFNNPSR